jgi:PAS domain S-box-containing protein
VNQQRNQAGSVGDAIQRFQAFLKNCNEAIFCIGLKVPIPIDLPEAEQIEQIYAHAFFQEANDVYARLAGFQSGEEMIGRPLADVMPRNDPRNIDTLKRVIRSRYRRTDIETVEVNQQGDTYYLLNNVIGEIEDGRLIRAWGTARDITRFKQVQVELMQSEANLRAYMDNTVDAICARDKAGALLFWNRAFNKVCQNIFGVEASVGLKTVELIPESQRGNIEHIVDIWRRVFNGETVKESYAYTWPNGETHFLETTWTPIQMDGRIDWAAEVTRDITEMKLAETELRRQLDQIKALQQRIEDQCNYLQEEIKSDHDFETIVGDSDAIKYVLYRVVEVAPTDTSVLIMGETGTGKELIARVIHNESQRNQRPLVKVNCAALPATLIESELFGHVRGAFTGAEAKRVGRFELADGGTLFLDEISEIPLALQGKLLHVLQDGAFERLGSSETLRADVRIIAASNRNLDKAVKEGRFRQDLLYRINVFPLTIPPLRLRAEDIPALVQHFVDQSARKMGKDIERVPAELIAHLQDYDWPGNVRELENVIERAVITTRNGVLKLADRLTPAEPDRPLKPSAPRFKLQPLAQVERDHIQRVLAHTHGTIDGPKGAARILGLAPSTLRDRMKKLKIQRPKRAASTRSPRQPVATAYR